MAKIVCGDGAGLVVECTMKTVEGKLILAGKSWSLSVGIGAESSRAAAQALLSHAEAVEAQEKAKPGRKSKARNPRPPGADRSP